MTQVPQTDADLIGCDVIVVLGVPCTSEPSRIGIRRWTGERAAAAIDVTYVTHGALSWLVVVRVGAARVIEGWGRTFFEAHADADAQRRRIVGAIGGIGEPA